MTTVHPTGTVSVSRPSVNPLKLRAPFAPVSPAMSSNVPVRDAASTDNQLGSIAGSAGLALSDGAAAPPSEQAAKQEANVMDQRVDIGNLLKRRGLFLRRLSRSELRLFAAQGDPPEKRETLHPRLWQPEHEDRITERVADLEVPARGHGDELLAVDLEHGRRGVGAGAAIELPEHGAGLGVVRFEPAVPLAREDEVPGGGRRAAHHRELGLHRPRDLAGLQVDRVDVAVLARVPALLIRDADERATEPEPALLPRCIMHLVVHRLMQPHRVGVLELRMHRDGGP